jgi:hypothetical protein
LNEEWAGQIFRTEKPKKRKRIRKQPFGFKTCPWGGRGASSPTLLANI